MDETAARARFASARVARLATVRGDGGPHLVPVCFALDGERIVSVVDEKPKTTPALRRLDNIRVHAEVSLLVDHYEDDWSALWWVRVDGRARIVEGGPDRAHAIDALQAKYSQYRGTPPGGPVIEVTPDRWRSWSAS